MKRIRQILLVLTMILLCIGVNGCMNSGINKQTYEEGILTYLETKYDEDFSVDKIYQEFSGDTGGRIRAICKNDKYEEEFLVYCYLKDNGEAEKIEINGQEYFITDEYLEIDIQNQLLNEIEKIVDGNLSVKCQVIYGGTVPGKADYQKGMEYCLTQENFKAHVKIYVVSNDVVYIQETSDKLQKIVRYYNPYYACVFQIEIDEFDEQQINDIYIENYDSYDNFLANSDFAESVKYVVYDGPSGSEKVIIMKE